MASSFTTRLRLEKIGSGEQSGSWGTTTNNQYDLMDVAISGYLAIATGDANVTLTTNNGSSDQARYAVLKFTGTNTAQRDVIIPAVSKVYVIHNATTQNLRVKTSGGTAVTLATGEIATVYCDGTDCAISGVTASSTNTLTNKTINLSSNTLTGTVAQFNTALSDGDFATLAGSETLTNKTFNLTSNTLTGTTAQFNTALSDGDFATLAGSETLTNKTINLTSNTLTMTFAQLNTAISDANLGTAAQQDTGTSGANVPLMNGANTWSAVQTISYANARFNVSNTSGTASQLQFGADSGLVYLGSFTNAALRIYTNSNHIATFTTAGGLEIGGVAVPTISSSDTLSNKTLASPTLSGTLAGSPAASGSWVYQQSGSGSTVTPLSLKNSQSANGSAVDLPLIPTGTDSRRASIIASTNGSNQVTLKFQVSNAGDPADALTLNPNLTFAFAGASGTINGNTVLTTATGAQLGAANTFTADQRINANLGLGGDDAGFRLYILESAGTSPRITLAQNTVALWSIGIVASGADLVWKLDDTTERMRLTSAGLLQPTTIQARVATSSETSGTLTSASANKTVVCSGGVTLDDGVFTAGDCILFDPGTSARTFTRASGCTMYVNGTDSASATLAANQMGSAYWRSSSVVVLSGAFT